MHKSTLALALVVAGILAGAAPVAAEPNVMQLPKAVHDKVTALSKEGDVLASQAKYRKAVEKYLGALALLPEPKTQWQASTWLLVAIGDAQFLDRQYEKAKQALSDAMHCPDAIGNPFIHLRLGQSEFELGNRDRAADELARAYMGAGRDIFAAEDAKYFQLVKSVLKPPADGKW
jgi:predicted Zn-dependent protease